MLFLLLTLLLAPMPQEQSDEPTRAEELRLARESKAQNLTAPTRTGLEKALFRFKEERVLERFQEGLHGFYPLLGGMHTGSGFAFGGGYKNSGFDVSGQASLLGYQKYEARYSPQRLLGDHLFANVHATYRNYPQEDFFGTGNDSRKEDRVNYRLEDLNYGGQFGVRLNDRVKAGGQVGYIDTHVGAGTDTRFPTVAKVFTTSDLPALAQQPDYLQTGAFFEADYRDEAGNPHGGGRYTAKWSAFNDRNLGQYDFNQYDLEAQQYFPFFNQRRVIALRAKTTLTSTADGQEVPFFMQPTVGGSEDLRGYSEFRFRDRNMMVFNAEYRWEAFAGLDLALFADAGQVAHTTSELDLSKLKTAGGVGFRFNTAKSVFLRVDVGYSREGARVFMKFSHVF